MFKLILIGVLTVTSYRAVPEQTKPECKGRFACTTSTGDNVSEQGMAVSQDVLASGMVRYGDVLCVDGIGCRVVNDCMAPRIKRGVDLFVYTKAEEHAIGVQHRRVWVLRRNK